MESNTVFFAWNRPIPGREQISSTHFDEFVAYLTQLQQSGSIDSFDVVFLEPHGGDLNGFFLIRAEPAKLGTVLSSKDWSRHMTRASMHLEGSGAVRGVSGDAVREQMAIWRDSIPT